MSILFFNSTAVEKATHLSVGHYKLRTFLNKKEPSLIRWLMNTWRDQGKAITYKELRESILNGDLNKEIVEDWQQDYSRFVAEHLLPTWQEAFKESAKVLEARYPTYYLDLTSKGVLEWNATNSARFVTNVTSAQVEGLRAVVQRAATLEDMNVDSLARVIRPMVGLTYQQTMANLNYYQKLLDSGMKEKRAIEKSIKYSAKQHRYRAQMIARTELAFAYNQGEDTAVRQAQEQGLMGRTEKRWRTADDERTCEICGALDGKQIEMDEGFEFPTNLKGETIRRTPPAHPQCRCEVEYIEVEPPQYQPQETGQTAPEDSGNDTPGNYEQAFIPATSIKEANEYAKNKLGIPYVDYKGTSLEVANEWNRGLTDNFNRFPELKDNFNFVGTIQNRNKLAKKIMYQPTMEKFKAVNPGYTEKQLDAAVKKFIAKKYAPPVKSVTYAQSHRLPELRGITVSDKWQGERFLNALASDVMNKFHPEGADTIRSVLDHEIGHQLDNMLDLWDNVEITKLYRSMKPKEMTEALSEYAWNNSNRSETGEFIAEAWSEYLNNPNPRPVAKKVGEIIEEEYAKWLKSRK